MIGSMFLDSSEEVSVKPDEDSNGLIGEDSKEFILSNGCKLASMPASTTYPCVDSSSLPCMILLAHAEDSILGS